METAEAVPAEAADDVIPIEDLAVEEVAEEAPAEVVAQEKPKPSAQQRINEITRKRHEALREAEYWKNKALGNTPAPAQQTQSANGRPLRDNYEDDTAYEDDLVSWHLNKTVSQSKADAERAEAERLDKLFQERADKIREKHPDFDDVLLSEVYSKTMQEAMLESEDGPELAYWLGLNENHATANRIAAMSPKAQMIELGKLSTEIKLKLKTKKATSAPRPIAPVGATGGTPPMDDSKLPMDDWFKKREAARYKAEVAKLEGK